MALTPFIDGDRLWSRLESMARFGATASGGVCRLALSEEEAAARAQLIDWGEKIGLTPSADAAANLFLRLEGTDPSLPPLLLGSHLDSQVTGGKYDGAYGVLGALEAIEAIRAAGVVPRRSIDIVSWTNEEGSRFWPSMMGSAVFTGRRKLADVRAIRDNDGCSVGEALDALKRRECLPERPLGFECAGFLELHIEQGTTLQNAPATIGVASGMQGKRTFLVHVAGQESHSGTTRRGERKDAFVHATSIVGRLHQAMWDEEDAVRFTIGMFTVKPNAPSVVPAHVVFSIDLRHESEPVLRALGDQVQAICTETPGACRVDVEELVWDAPTAFPAAMRNLIEAKALQAGFETRHFVSPAGHDSRYLNGHCPTGLIFIPCKDGVSHSESEEITRSDARAGAIVLANVAVELTS